MNITKQKNKRIILGLILIIIVLAGISLFQILMNSFLYFILTWPIWLGKGFDFCLEFAEKSIVYRILIIGILIIIGLTLYKIKKNALMIFGVIEFVGGVFIFWGALITPSSDNLINAIALGSGLFLIVNGSENYSNGYSRRMKIEQKKHRISKNEY